MTAPVLSRPDLNLATCCWSGIILYPGVVVCAHLEIVEIFAGCLGPGPALDTTLARAQKGDSLGRCDPDSTLFLPSNSFMLFLLLHSQIDLLGSSSNYAGEIQP